MSRQASGLRWKINRLRVMGPAEILYRAENAVKGKLEKAGFGRVQPQAPQGVSGKPIAHGKVPALDPAPYAAAAEKVLAGHYRVFSLEAQIGFPPEWNRCPKTGTRAPLTYGKAINYREESIVGDIKYLWEPNRHLELVTLAQAWKLTGEPRYLAGCRTLLDSWFEQCPYPLGVNWTSSLEHSIRLVNWSFAWGLLGGDQSPLFAGEEGAGFKARWLASVREHLHFISGHFSKYSSANNHLLGEYLGLIVGCLTWPLWRECAGWLATAWAGFEYEALLQNTADGVNREQAIYYQHEVMDMMLIAGLLGRANGRDFAPAYWERLERLCDFMAAIMDSTGHMPMIGDSDDALIMRLDPAEDFQPWKPLLAAGAILFDRADLARIAGGVDAKTAWFFPEANWPDAQAATKPLPIAYPEGGYYVVGDKFGTPEEIKLVCDCAPLGYLSIAAHGHADALAFTLSAFGEEWLIDPGTYAYHTQAVWRDHFRATNAHNTLGVDGLDQSVIGGNFLWLDKAQARLISHGADHFEGEHDGYKRLPDPVTHRRRIELDAASKTIRVIDTLEAAKPHDITLNWQFAETVAVELLDGVAVGQAGGHRLEISCSASGFAPALLTGVESPPAGWISRRFDSKLPATLARWSGKVEGAARLETLLRFS